MNKVTKLLLKRMETNTVKQIFQETERNSSLKLNSQSIENLKSSIALDKMLFFNPKVHVLIFFLFPYMPSLTM